MNRVFIKGQICKEPEARDIPGKDKQHLLVSFDICNIRETPWGQEKKSYWAICAWNAQAKKILGTVHKGDNVIIEGELEKDIWECKDTGKKREKAKITIREVTLLHKNFEEQPTNPEEMGEPPF